MPVPKTASHLGRLHILGKDEIQNIFHLPEFTDQERFLYFSLTPAEIDILAESRSVSSKLDFILQLGYFKARHLFFNFEFQNVSADVEFVLKIHFPPHETAVVQKSPKTAINTIAKHRRIIAGLYNYHFCGATQRELIAHTAQHLARISGKPIYIFRELFSFLETNKIVLPSYSFLQKTVSKALNGEQERLRLCLKSKLTQVETDQLNVLLDESAGFYEITNLRREPKDFSFNEIKREIERGVKIKEITGMANRHLPSLEISNQSIDYYASLISYYRVDKLKRFDSLTTYLYLLCFVHQRSRRVNDNLINCLLARVKLYTDQAKEDGETQLSSIQLKTNQSINKAAAILRLMINQEIPPETPFGAIQQQAFEILLPDEINQVAEHLSQTTQFDEIAFRWAYIDKIVARIKLNLRPILTTVDFTAVAEKSDLSAAINFLRLCFTREQSLSIIKTAKFPVAFINDKHLPYLYSVDEKSKQKYIRADRYEFFIYSALAHAVSAGDVNCRESLKFRSFEDDLLDDESWRQKDALIEKANLPVLKQSVESHLQELEDKLEERLATVNRRISTGNNEHFLAKEKSSRWSLAYPVRLDESSDSFFAELASIDLYQVIRFVDGQTDFIDSFEHLRGRYVKSRAEQTVVAACLLAWGTNTGLGKMGSISDFKASALQTASDNFIRPETLSNANDRIIDEIAKFPLFQHYDINDAVHSSSDGQKFETGIQTVNSRYSPKYFGLKKGIVAYTLVANHIPVNARVIGANEHESHFVFDVLFNNTTKIQPVIHSTDTHGSNQVNFALLYLFGYQFAPRFKDIYETVTKSLYGFQHPSRYAIDSRLKPIRKINRQLIVEEWENIQRIVLSLAEKATTQHIITGKLSSYSRTNKTKQALWEYDNIIRSLYLLDYVDLPPLRQNVHQALNRGENYHQLKRAVAFANFGKLRFKSEHEQNIWNEAARLLTNCILYYNISILSELLARHEGTGAIEAVETLKQISPTAWQHINFMGRYEFEKPMSEINIAETVDKIQMLPRFRM